MKIDLQWRVTLVTMFGCSLAVTQTHTSSTGFFPAVMASRQWKPHWLKKARMAQVKGQPILPENRTTFFRLCSLSKPLYYEQQEKNPPDLSSLDILTAKH